jgi:hypothetical protein
MRRAFYVVAKLFAGAVLVLLMDPTGPRRAVARVSDASFPASDVSDLVSDLGLVFPAWANDLLQKLFADKGFRLRAISPYRLPLGVLTASEGMVESPCEQGLLSFPVAQESPAGRGPRADIGSRAASTGEP